MNTRLMTPPHTPHPVRFGVAAAILTALLALFGLALTPAPAHAAGRVDVSPAPSADGETTVTLSGSGFQYLPNAPGGIYVSFGVVQDPQTNSWAPSQGGKSGETFGYAATSGATILVSFAGGSSADAANALIEADGTWTAQMRIPGSSFPSISGNPHAGEAAEGATIDCLQVQCGVITFGAHGMVNAHNESFTPVSFMTAEGTLASGTAGQSFVDGGVAPGASTVTDDAATSVEVPGSGGAAPSGSTPSSEPKPADAPVAAAAPQTAQPAPEASGLSSSALVVGVLAFAVAALLGAVVFALVRRARAARVVRAAAAAQPPAAGEPRLDALSTDARGDSGTTPHPQTQETQINAAAEAIRHREGAL